MKYEITITQEVKYRDDIIGTFTNLAVAQQFIETVIRHFEKVSVSIRVITESEAVEEEKEEEE